MAYISVADSIGLSSIFSGGLRKTHLFWNRMRIGLSSSPKVVDFGTNRKGVCDFLLVINSNFGPILHHFWDMESYWRKIANFSYPTLVRRPLSNFWMKLTEQKLEGWGSESIPGPVILFPGIREFWKRFPGFPGIPGIATRLKS